MKMFDIFKSKPKEILTIGLSFKQFCKKESEIINETFNYEFTSNDFRNKVMQIRTIADLLALVQFYPPVNSLIGNNKQLGIFVSSLYDMYNLDDIVFVMLFTNEVQRRYYNTYEFYHVDTDTLLLTINKE